MKKIQLVIIGLLTIASCSKKEAESNKGFEYVFLKRSGILDTLHREIKYHVKSDSAYSITYLTKTEDDQYEESFIFPRSKNQIVNFTQLIDQKTIEFEDQDYIIYKYLMDYPDGEDEEMLYFYSPEYGILINKAAWWGNYDKLTDFGNSKDNKVIFFLTEMIANDNKDFYINWK